MALYDPMTPEDKALLARVREEFFAKSPIQIDTEKRETQWVDEHGRMWFGVWAGPAASTDNLLHEMAHFVEIDERRMGMHGWGLKLPRMQYMPGPYGGTSWCEPKTMQISAREIRVMALQHHLHLHLGIEPWRDKVPDLLTFLPDHYCVPGHDSYRPGRARRESSRGRWVLALYDRLVKSPRYSFEAFRAEWDRRNTILARRKPYRNLGREPLVREAA